MQRSENAGAFACRGKGSSRMRVLCILSMDSGIYCPPWMSDVALCGVPARGGKLLIENRMHVKRLARGDHDVCTRRKYTSIDSNEIALRESILGVKPHGCIMQTV